MYLSGAPSICLSCLSLIALIQFLGFSWDPSRNSATPLLPLRPQPVSLISEHNTCGLYPPSPVLGLQNFSRKTYYQLVALPLGSPGRIWPLNVSWAGCILGSFSRTLTFSFLHPWPYLQISNAFLWRPSASYSLLSPEFNCSFHWEANKQLLPPSTWHLICFRTCQDYRFKPRVPLLTCPASLRLPPPSFTAQRMFTFWGFQRTVGDDEDKWKTHTEILETYRKEPHFSSGPKDSKDELFAVVNQLLLWKLLESDL